MKLTHNKIVELSLLVHQNAREKGFWLDKHDKRKVLMLVITELSEAVEALRGNKFANMEQYLEMIVTHTFVESFEANIKNTFEDEIADSFIRLLDFLVMYSSKYDTMYKYYELELKAWEGIKIDCMTSMMFATTRDVQDIFYTTWISQKVGDSLGKLSAIAIHNKFDLLKHVEMKIKYNATRPSKHGKLF